MTRVLVLACGHCGVSADVAAFRLGVEASITWTRNLCGELRQLLRGRAEPSLSLILLAGRDQEAQAQLYLEATQAGVHPVQVRFLEAWRFFPRGQALVAHVRGAVARAQASTEIGIGPTREGLTFRGHLPRRSLLNPLVRYRTPLPRINPLTCIAASGCDLCIAACPAEAIARGVPPRIDPAKCTSCGLCIPACPPGAVGHPSMDFTGVEAEAAALADGPGLSLMVACPQAFAGLARRGISLDGDRWRVLEVSSPGSLRPLEVLRLRGLGFQRVIGVGLDDCCPDPPGAFLVVTALLKRLGMGGVVDYWDLAKGESPELWDNACVGTSTELPRATSLQELAKVLAPPEGGLIPLPGRGGGIMELDPSACTLCMVCAERCPSKALALESLGPGLIRLTFDHRACDGCVLCERVCPEHAITMRRAIDPAATFEPRILKEDSWTLCASCGVPVAPMSMVAQVQARLGSPVALDLCPDCKPTRGLPVQGLGIPQSASEKTK